MQAPTVDLDALGVQLGDAERLIDEQGSAVQVGGDVGWGVGVGGGCCSGARERIRRLH